MQGAQLKAERSHRIHTNNLCCSIIYIHYSGCCSPSTLRQARRLMNELLNTVLGSFLETDDNVRLIISFELTPYVWIIRRSVGRLLFPEFT